MNCYFPSIKAWLSTMLNCFFKGGRFRGDHLDLYDRELKQARMLIAGMGGILI